MEAVVLAMAAAHVDVIPQLMRDPDRRQSTKSPYRFALELDGRPLIELLVTGRSQGFGGQIQS